MKILHWREGGWWFGQQVKGKRTWINLETRDEVEAVRRVRTVRVDPIMRPAVGLLPAVDAFIAYKRSKGRYSKNSADTKVLILKAFARWLPTTATSPTSRQPSARAFTTRCNAQGSTQRTGENSRGRPNLLGRAQPTAT